jgi:ABC-type uncharacterized transport system auxiliary subunit
MRIQIIATVLLVVLLHSCGGQKEMVNRYYLIEIPATGEAPDISEGPVLMGSCEISRVEVAPVYERNQIVNRSDSHEITYYKYHLWAVRPSVSVRELMLGLFRQAGTFNDVSDRYGMSVPDYQFQTRIKSLEVLEQKHRFSAHVSLSFTLVSNAGQDVILFHEADRTVPLAEKDLNLFAGVVSRIFVEEFREFSSELKEQTGTGPGN